MTLVLYWLASVVPASANPVVTPTANSAALAAALEGPGVDVVSVKVVTKRTFQGVNNLGPAIGTVTGGPVGLDASVVFSSGEVSEIGTPGILLDGYEMERNDATSARCVHTEMGSPYDLTVVKVTFTLEPGYDGVVLDYTFATEESEGEWFWDDNAYDDGFGAFVATDTGAGFPDGLGENVALAPSGLDGMHAEGEFWTAAVASTETAFDWIHPRVTHSVPLPAGVLHGIAFSICDVDDDTYDSAGFVAPLRGCPTGCVDSLTVCGDGVLDAGETCDDGNVDALDGCSSGCLLEGP